MTEPEQWAEALWDHLLNKTFSRIQAIEAIQRAFEEQTRELREALAWYEEQARLCRLITSEGDPGRWALSADGGKRARKALATRQPTPTEGSSHDQ